MGFYLEEEAVSPNSADLVAVIQQSKIPFCCSIKLSNLNVSKSAYEVPPNLCPDPVAYCKSHFVASIIEFLPGMKIGRKIRTAFCFVFF